MLADAIPGRLDTELKQSDLPNEHAASAVHSKLLGWQGVYRSEPAFSCCLPVLKLAGFTSTFSSSLESHLPIVVQTIT